MAGQSEQLAHLERLLQRHASPGTPAAPYCACETPLIDVEHDAGCRRCGFPVRWTIAEPRHEGAQA